MKQVTKRQMVKEMVFSASEGKRTNMNFAEGMWALDLIPTLFSKEYITNSYVSWKGGWKNSKHCCWELFRCLNRIGTDNSRKAAEILYKLCF